ncbi:regulatory protein GemA [Shewanella sp. WXL01]|uniref:gp16 family protein n=1 Tax=Shewanella sp. WXL01 TaxID=2709721 RepID=UPI00143866CC|nr:regulatory protein GemA [Shewanella sp. WXL01]NKF51397.1 regulatory protein GemA [Shewanella sp. WXL01]
MAKPTKPKSWYIKMIHIGKNKLMMDDQSYRANCVALTGKASCLDMTTADLANVLEFMKSKGFKFKATKAKATKDKQPTPLDKLRSVWISMSRGGFLKDGSDAALNKWCQSQSKRLNAGEPVVKLEWLTPRMVHALIEQLKKWHMRMLTDAIRANFKLAMQLSQESALTPEAYEEFLGYANGLLIPDGYSDLLALHETFAAIVSSTKNKAVNK